MLQFVRTAQQSEQQQGTANSISSASSSTSTQHSSSNIDIILCASLYMFELDRSPSPVLRNVIISTGALKQPAEVHRTDNGRRIAHRKHFHATCRCAPASRTRVIRDTPHPPTVRPYVGVRCVRCLWAMAGRAPVALQNTVRSNAPMLQRHGILVYAWRWHWA